MKYLPYAASLLLILFSGKLISDARASSAADKALAEQAEATADSAVAVADSLYELYSRRADSIGALADSLERARDAAEGATTSARVRVDTLKLQVPDTGAVPRPLHDAIVEGYDSLVVRVETERDLAREEASLWRSRWAQADSGWTAERQANAQLQEALDRRKDVGDAGDRPGPIGMIVTGGLAGYAADSSPEGAVLGAGIGAGVYYLQEGISFLAGIF